MYSAISKILQFTVMYVRLYFVFIFCLGKNIMKSIRGGFKLKIIFCVERGHGLLYHVSNSLGMSKAGNIQINASME